MNASPEERSDIAPLEEFVISRTFDAPRELVYRAWTEAEQLMHWFGPKGFPMFHARIDLRPGGTFHYALRQPDGGEMWGKWVFQEIVPPEEIVVVSSFSDPEGKTTKHPGMTDWPLEMRSRFLFEDVGGKTKVTIRWAPVATSTEAEIRTFERGRPGMTQGWTGTFEQLEAYLGEVTK